MNPGSRKLTDALIDELERSAHLDREVYLALHGAVNLVLEASSTDEVHKARAALGQYVDDRYHGTRAPMLIFGEMKAPVLTSAQSSSVRSAQSQSRGDYHKQNAAKGDVHVDLYGLLGRD